MKFGLERFQLPADRSALGSYVGRWYFLFSILVHNHTVDPPRYLVSMDCVVGRWCVCIRYPRECLRKKGWFSVSTREPTTSTSAVSDQQQQPTQRYTLPDTGRRTQRGWLHPLSINPKLENTNPSYCTLYIVPTSSVSASATISARHFI